MATYMSRMGNLPISRTWWSAQSPRPAYVAEKPDNPVPTFQIDRRTYDKNARLCSHVKDRWAERDLVVFVDNCYGEFVEDREPCHVGADLIAGSLIKNPGGTIAKSGEKSLALR